MTASETRFVVDSKGRKKAVVLGIKEYSRLLERLEELEDALDLDSAVRTAHDFRNYADVRQNSSRTSSFELLSSPGKTGGERTTCLAISGAAARGHQAHGPFG